MLRIRLILLATLWLWPHVGCTGGNVFSGTKAKGDGDGRRPSEKGEGLVGYLTDPDSLEYERNESELNVRGGQGAIAVDGGSPRNLVVCLQQVARAQFDSLVAQGDRFGGSGVRTIAKSKAASDGSFALRAAAKDVNTAELLTIDVSGMCEDAAGSFIYSGYPSLVTMDFATEGSFIPVVQDGGAGGTGTENLPPDEALCAKGETCAAVVATIDAKSSKGPIEDAVNVIVFESSCKTLDNDPAGCIGPTLSKFELPQLPTEVSFKNGRVYVVLLERNGVEAGPVFVDASDPSTTSYEVPTFVFP